MTIYELIRSVYPYHDLYDLIINTMDPEFP